MTDLLTLDQAAKLIPGADASTLKRRIRQGKLSATRPGKTYLTTLADIQEMIEKCRVVPKVPTCGSIPLGTTAPVTLPTLPPGLSLMEVAEAALDLALAQPSKKKTKR